LSKELAIPVLEGDVLLEQLIVTLGGQMIMGGSISSMDMTWIQVPIFPQSSVAVKVRLITLYTHCPGIITSEWVMITNASQASNAVASPVNPGLVESLQLMVILGGQVTVGGVMSWTTIVLLQEDILAQSSMAVHVRVILYVPGQIPPVTASVNVTVTLISQASIAVGGVNTGTPGQPIGVVWFEQVMTGGVLSIIVMVCVQSAELRHPSIT